MISTQLSSWLLIIGFVTLVCVAVGATWLSHHLPDEPEDDVDRLLREDRTRERVNRELARSRRYPYTGSAR